MNPVKIISACSGLNTVVDPKRLPLNYQDLTSDLGVAVNIEIDKSGLISLGKGFSEIVSLANGHSGFCDGGDFLLMQGTSLYQVSPGYTLTGVRSGMANRKVCYAQDGKAIYYVNGFDNGIYSEGVSYVWNVDEDNELDSEKVYESVVPSFEKIAIFNGYMLGVIGEHLYASEFGLYGLWNMIPVFSGRSRLLMVKPVDTGVFVSDQQNIYFLRGLIPTEFQEELKTQHPAYEWSDATDYITDSSDIGIEEKSKCAVWSTRKGICVGTNSGNVYNRTRKKIVYPSSGGTGASIVIGNEVYSMLDEDFCLAINLENNAAYQKTGLSFNSFCRFGDAHIGVGNDALCSIGGDTYGSEDIDAYFNSITTKFNHNANKRLRYVDILVEGDGDITLTITVDDGTPWSKTETLNGETHLRIPIPRSLYGIYWNFKINNEDGIYFNVDEIKAQVIYLARGRSK